MEAYTGLLAAMVCIGACYSDRFSPSQVRDMTDFLKTVLERDCSANFHAELIVPNEERRGIEKLQALVLLHALLVWNGTPFQRETSLQLYPTIAELARKYDLLRVASDANLFSVLHQPNLSLESATPDNFQWETWVEQEKRIRLMHLLYLCDVSSGLYFNSAPQFDSYEMHIPLPADDAAWEAESPTSCAEALHLYGSDAAKARNPDGSQRSKQPELDLALRALLHSSYQIHPGSTNLYGKFILIHALLAQIRLAQLQGHLNVVNGSSTPLSQNDWIFRSASDAGSCNASANNSGRATPVSGLQQSVSPQAYQSISIALDKFKSNWDMDMAIQFPPSMQSPRRYGFSRDGIHYFWLARWILKNGRPNDLQLPRDHRFTQVIQLLKSVKAWVMSDASSRGEELGSVGDIDNDYGVNDLTLNMASLFKPLPLIVDSQAVASVKTEF